MSHENGTACEDGWTRVDAIARDAQDCAVPVLMQDVLIYVCFVSSVVVAMLFASTGLLIVGSGLGKARIRDLKLCASFFMTGVMAFMTGFPRQLFFKPVFFFPYFLSECIFFLTLVPNFFGSDFVSARLSAILSLDPRAKRSVYRINTKLARPIAASGVVAAGGTLFIYVSTSDSTLFYGTVVFSFGLGFWAVLTGFLLISISLRLRQMPASARAYLRESPKEARTIWYLTAVLGFLGQCHALICCFIILLYICIV